MATDNPNRGLGWWSRVGSAFLHLALLGAAVGAGSLGRGSMPATVAPEQLLDNTPVTHVFVPPAGQPKNKTARELASAMTEGDFGDRTMVDTTDVQLAVTASSGQMLAALQQWHGTLGIANESNPNVLLRTLRLDGHTLTTEPTSTRSFFSVRINATNLRRRYAATEQERLFALFPLAVRDALDDALRAAALRLAVTKRDIGGMVRLSAAAYTFDPQHDYQPLVLPSSLRWAAEH